MSLIVQSNHCELDFLNISQYTDMIVRANNLSAVKEASLQLVDKQTLGYYVLISITKKQRYESVMLCVMH
ncbi:hypothetical protein MX850_02760 [Erysipelothrix sp. Poltava]|nr:hypothetical protein MX850_02760 [Erysipelothrix sp. Poltava]